MMKKKNDISSRVSNGRKNIDHDGKKIQAFIVSRVDECPTGNFDIKCKFLKRSGDEK